MREYYQCAACRKAFAVGEEIDGYPEGFPTGFLCPHCRTNLVEAQASDDLISLRFGWLYMGVAILLGLLARSWPPLWQVSDHALINEILSYLAYLLVPSILLWVANRDRLGKPRVVYTRRVLKKEKHG